ncbi:neural cell adhesion molecule L1.2 isoform X1 [Oryzias melastigma]|uniref:neural cell adhesion molecule L1.2 isoform X1 n=1 Tax=Oryzias melastigma TaxID=30732 RepID=UPI000CF7E5B6|nr:neural cell adhesion molecule L1.2 isoform X1 [Oryzias melastigma]XP_024149858.1 neural cell adhesion molecule L1.2 isoform X1 [Oryzias melastigma]
MARVQQQQVCSRGQRSSHLPLVFLTFLCFGAQAVIQIPSNYHISDIKRPPVIVNPPKSVIVVGVDEFIMSCEASGTPEPSFTWTKDGHKFDPRSEPHLKVSEHLGSFEFKAYNGSNMVNLKNYQGKYVCYASNDLGTAMSKEATLSIDGLPSLQKEKVSTFKADEGSNITLKCNPPESSMVPVIHWMDWKLRHIELSDRVVVGKDGNLYFAYLNTSDSRDDYICNLQYMETRTILTKDAISLQVKPSNSVVRKRRPHMITPTGPTSTYLVLRGQTFDLECIAQGFPTPQVMWLRKDGELSESRTVKEFFNHRLRFLNISESDGGEYQCIAENTQGKAKHTFMLTVEAAPYWIKEPVSQLYAAGETVRLDCQADGTPSPTIRWTVNGGPLPENSKRIRVESGSLILEQVEFGDTAVYQCRASNKHGTIFTNTHVYVINLPPQILTKDGKIYLHTEGQKALLECKTFGSPKPKVMWERGGSLLLADPRVNLLTSGALEISNVTFDDKGLYSCNVQNSNLSITAELEVFNRTVILSMPRELKVQPGNEALFPCNALVDSNFRDPQILWRKDNQKLQESISDTKYTFDESNLIIADVNTEDEGVYTCEVITSLDMAKANGTLILIDRPDPPSNLLLADPDNRVVTLRWTPGDDHNSPVQEYVVEFEDQSLKERGWQKLEKVRGNKDHAVLSLWPYMSYKFRISAINDVGKSNPSLPSEIYNTSAEAPNKNPEYVRSESVHPDTLVIDWKEMEKHEFNGPDFHYKVLWRRAVGSGPKWHENITKESHVIIGDVGTYVAFEIKVQAANAIGDGPDPDPIIGYSGEDVPLESPMDVGVVLINSTTVKVTWAPIDRELVRGKLLGYKIHLTWNGYRFHHSHGSTHTETTIVEKTGPNEEKKVISNLRPFSSYNLAVTVFNNKGEGPPSDALPFETDEGVPGPPAVLNLHSPSETEMTMQWRPPVHPNGILTGYVLQYQEITNNTDSLIKEKTIDDPKITQHTLKGLDPHSRYRFYLIGRTATGNGEPIMKIMKTIPDALPIGINLTGGENLVNVSWGVKRKNRHTDFEIHYHDGNESNWKKIEKLNSSQSFYQLQGLTPGSTYHLQFVYEKKVFFKAHVNTTTSAAMQKSFATQGWFISVVSAAVLLLLILLILCFIKRSKGGKYSVKDKEDGPMDSEARPMKDETFGEYRSLESDLEEKQTASQPSLCEDSKLCSDNNLDFNGSSVITTELNLDESLVSEISRPSVQEGFHSLPPNSTFNPVPVSSATNGVSNLVTIPD